MPGPIQIADLNNAKTDVEHIEDIATSASLTATDRLGNVKKTVAGWQAQIDAAVTNMEAEVDAALDTATGQVGAAAAAADADAASASASATAAANSEAAAAGNATDGRGVSLTSYAALRAYSGVAATVKLLDVGVAGDFVYDSTDTTSTDNGTTHGTVIVASDGKRWKRRNWAPRVQVAGGSVSTGVNLVSGYAGNAVASDLGTSTISGGGTPGRENIIGGDGSVTVNTSTPNVASTGTQADYSVITGGYDNVAGGLASVISGFHNYTGLLSTHGAIGGGSIHKIQSGEYNTIGGGTQNTINTADSGGKSTIAGGSSNTINTTGGSLYLTIAGGQGNSITGNAVSRATIGGGGENAVSNTWGTVAGGKSNTVSGSRGAIGGGSSNTVSGTDAVVGGGTSNTASNQGATVPGGNNNTAGGEYSTAIGFRAKTTLRGQVSQATGMFAVDGDAQTSVVVLRRQTTSATPAVLRLDGSVLTLTPPDDTTWAFRALIVARRTDANNESAAYQVTGCIDRNAGTVALVGTPVVTVLAEDTAGWDVTCGASDANKELVFTVTGEAAKTINWVARVEIAEVTG